MTTIHLWPPTWRPPWPLSWIGSHGAHQRGKRNVKNTVKRPWRLPHMPWRPPCSTEWQESQLCPCGDRHKHHGVCHAVRPLKNYNGKNSVFPHSSLFFSHDFYMFGTAVRHMLYYILLVFRRIKGPSFDIQVLCNLFFHSFRHKSPL